MMPGPPTHIVRFIKPTTGFQRLCSGIAFMLSGSVVSLLLLLYDLTHALPYEYFKAHLASILLTSHVTPGFLAGVSGFIIGGDILNPDKVTTSKQAALRGFYVSMTAWVAYAVVLPVISQGSSFNMSFVGMTLLILVFGTILIGWLIAALGIGTGVLLFRAQRSPL
jgi:hypothetical protein